MSEDQGRLDLSPERRALLRHLLQRTGGEAGDAIPAGPADGGRPVSFGQERLRVLDQMRLSPAPHGLAQSGSCRLELADDATSIREALAGLPAADPDLASLAKHLERCRGGRPLKPGRMG